MQAVGVRGGGGEAAISPQPSLSLSLFPPQRGRSVLILRGGGERERGVVLYLIRPLPPSLPPSLPPLLLPPPAAEEIFRANFALLPSSPPPPVSLPTVLVDSPLLSNEKRTWKRGRCTIITHTHTQVCRPYTTTDGGKQNGSSVGTYTRRMHVFARLAPISYARSVLFNKIPASDLSRKFIKSALLVGYQQRHNSVKKCSDGAP